MKVILTQDVKAQGKKGDIIEVSDGYARNFLLARKLAIIADAKPLKSWPEVVDNLKQYSRVIASSFEGTTAYASGDYLLIDAKTDIPFKLLQKSDQRENLRNAVQEITGKRYILGPYKKAEKKEEKKDPLDDLIAELKDSNVEIIES